MCVSVDPVVGIRGGRIVAVFLHVHFEPFTIALVAPVGHFVTNAEEEGAATDVEPADEHAAEMTEMAHAIAGGTEGREKLDGGHDRDEGAHGNHDGEGEEPDLAIGKEDGIGDENAEDGPGSADGWDIGRMLAPENRQAFYEYDDKTGTNAAEKEVIRETLLTPDELEFTTEHPEHEHVDKEMPKAAVEKDVSNGLPDAQAGNDAARNQAEAHGDLVIGG